MVISRFYVTIYAVGAVHVLVCIIPYISACFTLNYYIDKVSRDIHTKRFMYVIYISDQTPVIFSLILFVRININKSKYMPVYWHNPFFRFHDIHGN